MQRDISADATVVRVDREGKCRREGAVAKGECKWKWERVVWVPPSVVVSSSALTLFFPFLSLSLSLFLWRWHPLVFPQQEATPPLQAVRHFSFVPWASHRVVFCCVVCVIYVTRNANTWVNMQNISQTMIWTDIHMHNSTICVPYIYTSQLNLCVCACVQMGSLAIVCRHDMCVLLMQRPKHSRSSNKPYMNGIHFDRLRRILMNRGLMTVYALFAIIKCFRLMRMFRKLPAKLSYKLFSYILHITLKHIFPNSQNMNCYTYNIKLQNSKRNSLIIGHTIPERLREILCDYYTWV